MAFGGKTVGSPNRLGEMTKLSSGAWAGDATQEGRVVYQKISHSHANDRAQKWIGCRVSQFNQESTESIWRDRLCVNCLGGVQ